MALLHHPMKTLIRHYILENLSGLLAHVLVLRVSYKYVVIDCHCILIISNDTDSFGNCLRISSPRNIVSIYIYCLCTVNKASIVSVINESTRSQLSTRCSNGLTNRDVFIVDN
ncbi:unnamed protein product [Schistosoma curassoni]|uniref:Ovule protein n=1 Tax=Schistosoma curassoni TaxID=6186 RepID=A0A183JC67_9TREM|nr:unnamed protein product [Schistosoma curassoni]